MSATAKLAEVRQWALLTAHAKRERDAAVERHEKALAKYGEVLVRYGESLTVKEADKQAWLRGEVVVSDVELAASHAAYMLAMAERGVGDKY